MGAARTADVIDTMLVDPRNIRFFVSLVAVAAVAAALAAAPAARAGTGAQYRIEGRGWGHGIGMSQYGANGFAQRGWTADRIIGHYFAGTVLAPRPAATAKQPDSLRVLLQSYLAPARIQVLGAGSLSQGGASLPLAAGDVVELRNTNEVLVATRVRSGAATPLPGSAADAVVRTNVDGQVRILFAADHAASGSIFRGTLTGTRFDGGISVVNTVPFESYLRGVVPDEMPPSWHPEALKAQAVAARSYALNHIGAGYSWFDVYSDTRSQVYGGLSAEEQSTDRAVAATAGMVARIGGPTGDVANTFFFSTSAGRTAANEQVWGSSPYSYLRSVESPWEQGSPYFYWRGSDVLRFTPGELAAKLAGSFQGAFRGATVTTHPSGYAKSVLVRGSGGSGTISGSALQSKLLLRSSFFRISYLMVTAPDSVPAGGRAAVSGRIPPAGGTNLVIRRAGTAAPTTIRLKPGAAGSWRVNAVIGQTTTFTLQRGGTTGPSVVVKALCPRNRVRGFLDTLAGQSWGRPGNLGGTP